MDVVALWTSYRTGSVFVIISSGLLLAPVLRYIKVGWRYKSEDITNSIDDSAKRIYLEKFLKKKPDTLELAVREFDSIYYRRFGKRHFTWPFVILTVLVVLESSLVIESIVQFNYSLWNPKLELNITALAAIAGAYMWVVSDFISRARRMDFSPSDIYWGTLRLFIAAPLGLAVGSILDSKVMTFIAFGLGAFPLETIQSALRQLSAKILKLDLDPAQTSELRNLDGVDKLLAERLAQEDISSIVQLAYCDPIQLTMRTNLSFNAVTDLVSQALAWTYIANKLTKLRPLGLRGAYEIRQWTEDLKNGDPIEKRNAHNIESKVAEGLELDADKIWFVLEQIADDPYIEFIYEIWG